ncbi:hypothetical protein [Arthrospiribacter ruber]|nr:hypothetical protein [Arthrospiribacter ruber]
MFYWKIRISESRSHKVWKILKQNKFIQSKIIQLEKKYILLVSTEINMKNLSLKLDDDIFQETEELLSKLEKSRNRYVNEALAYYNKIQKRKYLEKALAAESKLVSMESMDVLSEFEQIEDGEG